MSLDPHTIETEARFIAIEHLFTRTLAMILKTAPDPRSAAQALRDSWRKGYENQTIPGADPAQSDLISDAIAQEIDRILRGVEETLNRDDQS